MKNSETQAQPRDYVIVCNKQKRSDGSLLFWGRHTEDSDERCFGGYTADVTKCERYSREELKERSDIPVWGDNPDEDIGHFWRYSNIAITIDDLVSIGFRQITIMKML